MQIERSRRARTEVARLSRAGLDSVSFTLEVERVLRPVVPFDRACWHNVDPATAMLTSVIGDSAPDSPLLPLIEYAHEDVNKYSSLARAARPASSLLEATGGKPERSRRYREVLSPMGVEDELTAAFVSESVFWGCARLYRSRGRPQFDSVEIAYLASLSAPLAEGYRRAMLSAGPTAEDPSSAPGLLVLDEHDRLEAITPAAERWLEDLIDVRRSPATVMPHQIYALAAKVRSVEAEDGPSESVRGSRLPTRSGQWLITHGSRLSGPRSGSVAIILEPAPSIELAPLIVEAYGLSDREREITRAVATGRSDKEIAALLGLSRHTVADHLQNIYEKTSVRSRGELVARVFFDRYYPGLSAGPAGRAASDRLADARA